MATEAEVRTLTGAYRLGQVRTAAAIAALVAAYYKIQVDVENPASVERWLEIMLPRILSSHDRVARLAATYAAQLRRIELPGEPEIDFDPAIGAVEEQVRKSLQVVGPGDYLNKMRDIQAAEGTPQQKRALLVEAKDITAAKIAGAVSRHVQNGGRQTIIDGAARDQLALGYVRVTRDKPCFFCAMLASRGLVFAKDSFDASNARFTGDGTAKVHDSCQCGMKAVYTRKDDPFLKDAEKFTDMWTLWGAGGGGQSALLRFRRGYEHWLKTGEFLDWDVVNDAERYRARSS